MIVTVTIRFSCSSERLIKKTGCYLCQRSLLFFFCSHILFWFAVIWSALKLSSIRITNPPKANIRNICLTRMKFRLFWVWNIHGVCLELWMLSIMHISPIHFTVIYINTEIMNSTFWPFSSFRVSLFALICSMASNLKMKIVRHLLVSIVYCCCGVRCRCHRVVVVVRRCGIVLVVEMRKLFRN